MDLHASKRELVRKIVKYLVASISAATRLFLSTFAGNLFAAGEPESQNREIAFDQAVLTTAISQWITEYHEIKDENAELKHNYDVLLGRLESIEENVTSINRIIDEYEFIRELIADHASRLAAAESITKRIQELFGD